MKDNKTTWVIVALICLVAGIFIGRKTVEEKVVVRYIRGDSISGTVSDFELVSETVPDAPVLPLRIDTVFKDSIVYIDVKVDTASIINDYIARREFTSVLFDTPQLGKLTIFETIQYNRPEEIRYDFIPIYTEKTIYRSPVWQPYTAASFNTFNQLSVGAGVFYRKTGFEFQYITDFNRRLKGYGVVFKYMF